VWVGFEARCRLLPGWHGGGGRSTEPSVRQKRARSQNREKTLDHACTSKAIVGTCVDNCVHTVGCGRYCHESRRISTARSFVKGQRGCAESLNLRGHHQRLRHTRVRRQTFNRWGGWERVVRFPTKAADMAAIQEDCSYGTTRRQRFEDGNLRERLARARVDWCHCKTATWIKGQLRPLAPASTACTRMRVGVVCRTSSPLGSMSAIKM
jgi:hypothetical protein